MNSVECHGCERQFDRADVRWFLPFAEMKSAGDVLETTAAVTANQVPGSVPYCPSCLPQLLEGLEPLG